MIGTKELAVLILFFSSTSWGCFGGSGAPEGAVSDFCQICTDMVTKANELDIMESEEYLRHVSYGRSRSKMRFKGAVSTTCIPYF